MPKAVKMKLLSVLVIAVCTVVLYLSLSAGATFQWAALALECVGCAFAFMNC